MRVLLIDDDRTSAHAMAMACFEHGIAIRIAETLCEGVRYMLDDGPISAVLIDASLMRLSGTDQLRLFETVAPGVPVVVMAQAGAALEVAKYRGRGFHAVSRPVDILEVLATLDLSTRALAPHPAAPAEVETLCR